MELIDKFDVKIFVNFVQVGIFVSSVILPPPVACSPIDLHTTIPIVHYQF